MQQADAFGHQAGIGQRAGADHAVDAFLDQIDRAVGQADHQFDVGIALFEFGQFRQHDHAADGTRHVHTQAAFGLPRRAVQAGFGFFDEMQNLAAAVEIFGAVGGQIEASRGALKQSHVEKRLEIFDDARDR